MTEFETKCYGMTEADIREQYMNSLTARVSGLEMVAMGVLSDAQELMTFGHAQATDQARKKSKTILLCQYQQYRRQWRN